MIARARALKPFGSVADGAGALWLSAGLVFLLGAAGLAAANVAETLFVKRVGPAGLPLAIAAEGVLALLALSYVGASIERGRRLETLHALLVAAGVAPLALLGLILVAPESPLAYGVTFAVARATGLTLALTVAALVAELARGSGSGFAPPVLAAGLLGEAFGSLLSAPLAVVVGVESTLVLASLLALGAGLLTTRIADRSLIRLDVARAPKLGAPSPRAAIAHAAEVARDALATGRRSGLLRFLLAMAVAGALVAPAIDFLFHARANAAFATELDLLGFYAWMKGLLALVAVALQLLAFRWLRRRSGVASSVVVVPLVAVVAGAAVVASGGLLVSAVLWAVLRLGSASIDDPARRFLAELFPAELRDRVEWLVHRTGPAVGLIAGALLLLLVHELGGPPSVAAAAALLAGAWLALAVAFRRGYARLVLQASLMNRVDFDALRPETASAFLDRDTVRQLEREVVSGVPARAQLAIELLREVRDARLPLLLAASYLRQPPALRPLFLSTIQQSLRETPPDWPGLRPVLASIARLARSRLTAPERAVLIRVYGQAAARGVVDRKEDAVELLDSFAGEEVAAVRLGVAGARYLIACADGTPDLPAATAALEASLDATLRSPDEQDVHVAVGEVEELIRFDPARHAQYLDRLLPFLALPHHARVRAHVVASVARLGAAVPDDRRDELDRRIVPLALDPDPRLAAAALDYMRDRRYLPLLATHVLPNLTAGNHHVRECAAGVVRHFGEAAMPVLLDVVRSGSRRERAAVARLLGSHPVPRPAHRELIAEEMAGLARQLAYIHLLRGAPHPAPYALLAARLEEGAQEHLRAILRLLYAESGDESLIRVERQLWSRDPALRAAALEALEHVARGYPETARLRRLVDDTPLAERVRESADLVPDPPADLSDLLRRCTTDPSWVTRLVTCHTVGRGGHRELADVLAGLAAEHRAALRQEAARAHQKLTCESVPEEAPMTTVERMLLLKETELFRNLDARDLAGIAGVLREQRYAPGETLMREGDRGDFLAIIADGQVDITKADGRGGQAHIRTLGKADVVGEIALLEEGPRSASVVAKESCAAALLGRAEFEALVEEYPGVALGLARVLSQRLQTMTTQAARR